MSTWSSRMFALIICMSMMCMLVVWGVLAFLGKDVNPLVWLVVLSACMNFLCISVIMRFLWYQDQYFAVMNAFYPVVNRLEQVSGSPR